MTRNHFSTSPVQFDGSMVRTLIADYEPLARAHLHRLLSERGYDPAQCSDPELLGPAIDRLRPQLVFLDLDLLLPGLHLYLAVIEPSPAIIVTSAHRGATAPDDLEPVDYLLKPFDRERFQKVLTRAEAFLGAGSSNPLRRQHLRLLSAFPEAVPDGGSGFSAPPHYLDRVLVRDGERIVFIKAEEIDRIEARDEGVEIHVCGRTYLLRADIDALARKLDPRQFLSIRRSQIVNLDRLSTREVVQGAH